MFRSRLDLANVAPLAVAPDVPEPAIASATVSNPEKPSFFVLGLIRGSRDYRGASGVRGRGKRS